MPAYLNTAFDHAVPQVTPDLFYSYGSILVAGGLTQPVSSLFQVNNVALTSNVATITGVLTGPIPQVGALIGVRGTQTNSGAFNVDSPPTYVVSAVSINASTGAGTISFNLTHANIASTADVGMASILPYETPQSLVLNGAGAAIALTRNLNESDGSRVVSAQFTFTTIPTSATISLQVADRDENDRYYTVGTVATVAGSAVTQTGAQFTAVIGKFMRLACTALSGTGAGVGTLTL